MFKRNVVMLIGFILMFCLVGCKNDVNVYMPFSKLSHVYQTKEAIYIKSDISFEVATKTEYEKSKDYLYKLISNCFSREVTKFRLEQENYHYFVKCSVKVPLLHLNDQTEIEGNLFGIGYGTEETSVWYNKTLFDNLKKECKDKYMVNLNIENIKFNISLYNDLDHDININCYGNYLNNKPVPFRTKQTIEIGDELCVRLSNVSLKFMEDKRLTYLFDN